MISTESDRLMFTYIHESRDVIKKRICINAIIFRKILPDERDLLFFKAEGHVTCLNPACVKRGIEQKSARSTNT